MVELTVVERIEIPKGEKVTYNALMPKLFCSVENGTYKMFVGKEKVRTFRRLENAVKKYNKLAKRETAKAKRLLKAIGNPVITKKQNIVMIQQEENIGFDNVI